MSSNIYIVRSFKVLSIEAGDQSNELQCVLYYCCKLRPLCRIVWVHTFTLSELQNMYIYFVFLTLWLLLVQTVHNFEAASDESRFAEFSVLL